MAQQSPVLFQPETGWVGDVIPFERGGVFHLFYLHELRDSPKPGTAWNLVTTRDFVDFEDHGVAIAAGSEDEPDFNAYTGSVVNDGEVDHIFYTGHNPHHLGPDGATPVQLVMHAVSFEGLRDWQKRPEDTFGAGDGYEPSDWRDPFVFRPTPEGPWRMVLAARHDRGPVRRRGVLAQLVSDDLRTWRPAEPFWDPRRYVTHECPDVFRWGAWWYLVYSEFSENFTTRYRMSSSPDGPWHVPVHDSVDGRAFYASKSVERNGRRFFCGWIASKEGSRDDGSYQWAGTMSVLEALQRPDGTLGFTIPRELRDSFGETVPIELVGRGAPERAGDDIRLDAPDGYASQITLDETPSSMLASVTVHIEPETTECGVFIRASSDGDESYILRLEPRRSRIVLDRWPRSVTGDMQWQVSGDVPFAIELERPCTLSPGDHSIVVMTDGSSLVAVVDDSVTLSARIYDRDAGHFGLFAGEGAVTFRDLTVRTRAPISGHGSPPSPFPTTR